MSRNPLTIKGERFVSRSSPPGWPRCRSRSPRTTDLSEFHARDLSRFGTSPKRASLRRNTRWTLSVASRGSEKRGCKGEDKNEERKLRDSAGGQNGECKSGRDRLRPVRSRTAYTEENRIASVAIDTVAICRYVIQSERDVVSRRNTAYSSASVHIVKSVKTRV